MQEESREYTFGAPQMYKKGYMLEVDVSTLTSGGSIAVSAAIDGGSYSSLGNITSTGKTMFRLSALGEFRRIKFKFVESTQDKAVTIDRYTVSAYPKQYLAR